MANIKSAKKRIKVINKKTLRNKMIKSQVKTAMKKVIVAVNAGDKETAAVALKNAVSAIDRAYIKGIYHKNAVAEKEIFSDKTGKQPVIFSTDLKGYSKRNILFFCPKTA